MDGIDFLKMHGLGNDFVILDARARDIPLDPAAIRHIADRHVGVGCDQLIRLEPSDRADVFMRIWNPGHVLVITRTSPSKVPRKRSGGMPMESNQCRV